MSSTREGSSSPASGSPDEPIAIVGIGCRYADARGPAEFWDIVRSGRDTVREAPAHRIELGYDLEHFFDPTPRVPGRISSKKGGFLEHPELFDPEAFGLAPRDAVTMDPQQRLMIEVTWDALEDAGIPPTSVAGKRMAVILGYMAEDYSRERTGVLGEEQVFRGHDVFTVGGMSHAVLSGRIAFLLGVTGPSFTLDTACSSSLIATHLACQSLRRGEADLAVAGGANLFLSPEGNIALSRSGMLSMSGACRAFDANADGFVRAEGAGVVLLKRISDALADEDPIYAVIRGSGISSDGRDGGHMMAPGRLGQAQAMRDAYAQAGVDPARVQYVETHGTGTAIGDPVEIGALADVMGPGRDPERPLRVASVKGNLGHTESASGVAGLIKACLSIHHRTLPAQLHFETPNPTIPWDEIPVRVQDRTTGWPEPGPALVGVNSFGISGTNAHVVLESPPERAPSRAVRPPAREGVLALSAHHPRALQEMVEAVRERLDDPALDRDGDPTFHDLLYTFACKRDRRAHRAAFRASSPAALRSVLDAALAGEMPRDELRGVAPTDRHAELVMVFPGQGSQWVGMGRDLLRDEPVFADSIDALDAAYRVHVDWSLRSMLESARDADDWPLDVLQPVLVAFEIALAELLRSFGVVPDRVVGQSMGEIAAAYVAGALDVAAVARLACVRGRLVARASGKGAMAVVAAPRETVQAWLDSASVGRGASRVEIAGMSSPNTTIVSGDRAAVRAFVVDREAAGEFVRLLDVDFASHCFHMDPLLDDFRAALDGLVVQKPAIPFHSSVDGEGETSAVLDADHWVRNLRRAVALDDAVRAAASQGGEVFLEISPHPTLGRAIDETGRDGGHPLGFVASLARDEPAAEALARCLAALFVSGVDVDFARFGPTGRVVPTPLYPYQRVRYWFSERTRLDRDRPTHPLLGSPVDSSTDPGVKVWETLLDADTAAFVADREVVGETVVLESIFLEMAIAASARLQPDRAGPLVDLVVETPLSLGATGRRRLQLVARPRADDFELIVSSRADREGAEWTRHATATLRAPEADAAEIAPPFSAADWETVESALVAEGFARSGVVMDRRSRALKELRKRPGDEVARSLGAGRLLLSRSVESEWHAYHAHPVLVDAALQVLGFLAKSASVELLSIQRIRRAGKLGSEAWCRVELRDGAASESVPGPDVYDVSFHDRDGGTLAELRGVRVATRKAIALPAAATETPLALAWRSLDPLVAANPSAAESGIRRWLVVSDDASRAELLASELRKRGDECRFCPKIEDLALLAPLMRASSAEPWGLVVLAWGTAPSEGTGEPRPHRDYRVGSWAEAIRSDTADAAEIWIATRGLLPVEAAEQAGSPIARSVAAEIEQFTSAVELDRCRVFDASARADAADRSCLVGLLGRSLEDRWLALRSGVVRVPRLVDPAMVEGSAESRTLAEDSDFRVVRTAARRFGSRVALQSVETTRGVAIGSNEVVVEVEVAGLSRVDVLAELDERAGGAEVFGLDFCGRIVSTSPDVTSVAVGDRVVGLVRGAMSRRLRVEADRVARVSHSSHASDPVALAAATFPTVVADHVLDRVVGLRAGERVLVDAGRGAVGHALVAGVRRRGAFPLGSEDGDEASLDVILSHASGGALRALAARLGPFGRFVDLRGPASPGGEALELPANASFSRCDLVSLVDDDTRWVAAALTRFVAATAGSLAAPPSVVFPVGECARAFRYAAQGRHVGRVCLDFRFAEDALIRPPEDPRGKVRRLLVSAHGPTDVGDLAAAFRRRGVEAEVVEASTAARRPGGVRVHVDLGDESGREDRRAALVRAGSDGTLFVSLRDAAVGVPAEDRAWESRLLIDLLARSENDGAGWTDLSIDGGASIDRIVDVVMKALEAETPRSLVWIDPEDEARWQSPLAREAAPREAAACGYSREALAAMSIAERRGAMLGLVANELAAVLDLDEARVAALEPGRRLDALGLDSLMTMELFVGLSRSLSLDIERDWFEGLPSLAEIAGVLAERVGDSAGEGRR